MCVTCRHGFFAGVFVEPLEARQARGPDDVADPFGTAQPMGRLDEGAARLVFVVCRALDRLAGRLHGAGLFEAGELEQGGSRAVHVATAEQ